MCTWMPRRRSPPRQRSLAARSSRSPALRPNLLSPARPPGQGWSPGSTSGFNRRRTGSSRSPPSSDVRRRSCSSESRWSSSADSTATHRRGAPAAAWSTAASRSASVLPTPSRVVQPAGTPAERALAHSPQGDDVGTPATPGQHLGDGREVVGLEGVLPHPGPREGRARRRPPPRSARRRRRRTGGSRTSGRRRQPLAEHRVQRPSRRRAAPGDRWGVCWRHARQYSTIQNRGQRSPLNEMNQLRSGHVTAARAAPWA